MKKAVGIALATTVLVGGLTGCVKKDTDINIKDQPPVVTGVEQEVPVVEDTTEEIVDELIDTESDELTDELADEILGAYAGVEGKVIDIEDIEAGKLLTLETEKGDIVKFTLSEDTYVLDDYVLSQGDIIVGYYATDIPVILIYPPQYPASVIAKVEEGQNIKVDKFNEDLISQDNHLKLNISEDTVLTGGSLEDLANRDLLVVYGPSTRSIPAQTTPLKVVVLK